jgi:diguanylate cyclase (GGDEF)-like protein/PAS domain S-box-containing protein
MEISGMLPILSLLIDVVIAIAFARGLLRGRSPRRWRGTLGVLTGVALLNLVQSVLSLGEAPGVVFSAGRLVHAGEVLALAGTVIVFRREMLQPSRLLDRADGKRSVTESDLDAVQVPVISLTHDGVIRHVNLRAAAILNADAESLAGSDLFRLMGTYAERRRAREDFMRFVGSAGTLSSEWEDAFAAPDGELLIRWHRSAQFDSSGAVVGVVCYGEDITEQRRTEARLHAESYFLDSVHDAVAVRGPAAERLYFNRAMHDMLGLTRQEFVSLPPFSWVAPESIPSVERHLDAVQLIGDDIMEIVAVRKDGSPLPLESRSQRIDFDGQTCTMTVFRDISSRYQAQDLMTQMAFTDALTGLPNRRTVEARLSHALDRFALGEARPSVLYLDVDNLKSINDTLGHDAGDRLISMVGERLTALLRDGDTVGRMGGDEFVVVLPQCGDALLSEEVARRLLEGLSAPLRLDGHELCLGVSIGVVDCERGMTADDVIVRADRAMYTAKRSGGRRVIRHSPAMDEEFLDRFTLKNDLARALDRREFILDFQPIVAATSGHVVAAEALLRWNHPVRGVLAPGLFIDLAEQAGIIREMGRWVIAEACAALVTWRHQGMDLARVSVNVSPLQLRDPFFISDVLAAVALHGLEPGSLELEITETQAMEYTGELEVVFTRLREEGIRIALDDFGVGHSSLERLRGLPITTLKLDRTFVADLCTTSHVHPIIDTVLVLASNLRLDVVAEGVETSCQADYLREAGCQMLQGFAFARPMDAQAFSRSCAGVLMPDDCEDAGRCQRDVELRADVHRVVDLPRLAHAARGA